MAERCGMGLSTIISIEKGSAQVSLAHWILVLEVFEIQAGLFNLGEIFQDKRALVRMRELVPKRATARQKRA